MGDLSQTENISLFDAPPPESYVHAKDFVRWCWSFGGDFRNSPDVTNLRYWARKNDIRVNEVVESEILQAARPLFLKRLEQSVRNAVKSEALN